MVGWGEGWICLWGKIRNKKIIVRKKGKEWILGLVGFVLLYSVYEGLWEIKSMESRRSEEGNCD